MSLSGYRYHKAVCLWHTNTKSNALLPLAQLGGTIYPINIAWAAAFDDDLAHRVRSLALLLSCAQLGSSAQRACTAGHSAARCPGQVCCACLQAACLPLGLMQLCMPCSPSTQVASQIGDEMRALYNRRFREGWPEQAYSTCFGAHGLVVARSSPAALWLAAQAACAV